MTRPLIRAAIGNEKGGLGKTTTAVSLAAAAAKRGLRTLLIDGDTSANASTYLTGFSASELDSRPTWGAVVIGQAKIRDAILTPSREKDSALDDELREYWRGIDLLPSARTNAQLDMQLGVEHLWNERDAIDEIAGDYDVILIDCPPHLGTITVSHLYAVDQVLIVTEAAAWALDGINNFSTSVRNVARSNTALHISGVLINRFVKTESGEQEYAEHLKSTLGDLLIEPPVPRRSLIKDASNSNIPITAMRGAKALAIAEQFDAVLEHLIQKEK